MAERHFSVRPGPWLASLLVIALSACSTTPGRQAPVDDVSVGGRAPQGVVSPGTAQGAPGGLTGGAPSGGSISSEDISSDDLMGGVVDDIPMQGAALPRGLEWRALKICRV